jgi:hypothetical protein
MRVPSGFDLNPHQVAHVHRFLPTQRVTRGGLFRPVEQTSDPYEVPKSQIVNVQRLPFAITQNLLEFEEGP